MGSAKQLKGILETTEPTEEELQVLAEVVDKNEKVGELDNKSLGNVFINLSDEIDIGTYLFALYMEAAFRLHILDAIQENLPELYTRYEAQVDSEWSNAE